MATTPRFSHLISYAFSVAVCALLTSVIVVTAQAQGQEPGFFRPNELVAPQSPRTQPAAPSLPVAQPQVATGTQVATNENARYPSPFPPMTSPSPSSDSSPSSSDSGYAISVPQNQIVPSPQVAQAGSLPQGDKITQNASDAQLGQNEKKDSGSPDAARIPLARPDANSGTSFSSRPTFGGSLLSMFGSLILVLGLFLLIAWGMKKLVPAQNTMLPRSVLQSLGQFPLTSRNRLFLLRFGKKLLLVSVCGDETSLVCEVDNESEVAELLTQLKPGGHNGSLRGGPGE